MQTLKQIFRQTSWQVFGKGISSLSTIVVLGLITRTYGAEGTGLYTLALTYLSFFYLFADLGLNGYVLTRLSHSPDEANKLFNFRLAWGLILGILSVLLLPLFPFNSTDFSQAVLIGSTSIICFGLFNTFNLIFQKELKYEKSIIATSLGAVVTTFVIIFLIQIGSPVPFLILGMMLGWIVNVVTADILVGKHFKFSLAKIDLEYPFKTLKNAWAVAATLLINTIYFRIDAFILSSLKSMAEVGFYNFSYQIFQTILVIPTFIMNAYYPKMIKTFESNFRKFKMQIDFASIVMLLMGVFISLIVWFSAPLVVNLIAGKGFEGSVTSLRILALSMPAFFLSALYIWVLMTIKKYKMMFYIYLVGFIFNALMNLKFIPAYSYMGAAVITVLSEYSILFMQIVVLTYFFKKHVHN